MTVSQRPIEQARLKVVHEALQKEFQECTEEVRQRFREGLIHIMRERFGGEVDAHVEQCFATASGDQLATWMTRLVLATTLAEVLAD